uniref:Uncharacterized protein n=1 Tax=Ditylenchus dipsaci TaxID=166011 RepID=A0A915DP37_9BILA
MVFPFSRHASVRSLLFRNEGNKSLTIKIVSSSPEVLCVDVRNRILVCDSGDVVNVDVKLNAEKLEGEISNSELKQHFLSIYCSEVHEEAELVHKLKIVRSKEFAALETVIDLHGKQGPQKPVLVPSFGVDDSDCKTAHNVDSDTETAMPLSDNEFLDLLPPNSAVHTAQDGTKCWLAQLLGNIFRLPMLLPVSKTSKAKILLLSLDVLVFKNALFPSIKSLLTDCIAVMCSCQ